MSKCADCRKDAPLEELVADHIIPLSRGGKAHDPENIRWVHRSCHLKKANWFKRLWWAIRDWLADKRQAWDDWLLTWLPCPKEERGYRCQHRIMSNGQKECGPRHNYWGGGDE